MRKGKQRTEREKKLIEYTHSFTYNLQLIEGEKNFRFPLVKIFLQKVNQPIGQTQLVLFCIIDPKCQDV